MLIRHANLWIGPLAELPRHHEREHSRQVRLIRHGEQIEHQPDMFLEVIRNADWRVRRRQLSTRVLFRPLDPPLNLTDVLQILPEPGTVAYPQTAPQRVGLVRDDVEDAQVALPLRAALPRRARLAEQALEDHTGIDL